MEMKLADNIRMFRKERALTQEQLAEVLGVTVGAVYKWEAKLSIPELPLILEMADFFDTSMDALLGYELKDNRLDATLRRLWQFHREKDRNGLSEVEKALKKYPGAFQIVYAGATLYHGIGLEARDRMLLRRALELYGKARQLLPQNRDATISEQTLCGCIAQVYFALGEKEKAIELTKAQNAGNLYSAMIGTVLVEEMNRPEEAVPYLSEGLMLARDNIIYSVLGFAGVYRARRDLENGSAILQWGIQTLQGLKASEKPDFTDKLCAVFHAYLAGFQMEANDSDAARDSLKKALSLAQVFDAAPDYSRMNLRFVSDIGRSGGAYDTLGATVMEALENAVKETESAKLWEIYRKISADAEIEEA